MQRHEVKEKVQIIRDSNKALTSYQEMFLTSVEDRLKNPVHGPITHTTMFILEVVYKEVIGK